MFEVADAERAFRLLDGRGGTPIDDIARQATADGGELASFSVTTPFGDTTFRFVERRDTDLIFGGMERYPEPRGGHNRHRFTHVDHVTSNFETMSPALLWLEHVMGFVPYWDVAFHTAEVTGDDASMAPACALA